MNRISKTLKEKDNILSIYFTAGFPELNSTIEIIKNLVSAGVDMIEIGLPFSDPLADGETIQMSSKIALDNGISTNILFEQLKEIRNHINIPLIIMGYFNPIFQFGVEEFCKKCNEVGIDGFSWLNDLAVINNQSSREIVRSWIDAFPINRLNKNVQSSSARLAALVRNFSYLEIVSNGIQLNKVNKILKNDYLFLTCYKNLSFNILDRLAICHSLVLCVYALNFSNKKKKKVTIKIFFIV